MAPRAARLMKRCLVSLRYDFNQLEINKGRVNLTSGERTALRQMLEDKDVVVSKADKGDVTVIMPTSQYLELAYRHLSDESTYQLLRVDPTPEIAERFRAYLDTCVEKVSLTDGSIVTSTCHWT